MVLRDMVQLWPGSAGLAVRLDDLNVLFQSRWFVILWQEADLTSWKGALLTQVELAAHQDH